VRVCCIAGAPIEPIGPCPVSGGFAGFFEVYQTRSLVKERLPFWFSISDLRMR
jgi:hypothetical protein